jgi:hypothetical protein
MYTRVTNPRSNRSSAWRSVGGGKSTCRVARRDFWFAGRDFNGFEGASVAFGREYVAFDSDLVVDLASVVSLGWGGEVESVFRRDVKRARGVGRGWSSDWKCSGAGD